MPFVSESGEFTLFMEVLKLEGKLAALQRISGLTTTEGLGAVVSTKTPAKLNHTTSATSTDCPDGSSTTEAMDTPRDSDDDDEEVSSESDSSE